MLSVVLRPCMLPFVWRRFAPQQMRVLSALRGDCKSLSSRLHYELDMTEHEKPSKTLKGQVGRDIKSEHWMKHLIDHEMYMCCMFPLCNFILLTVEECLHTGSKKETRVKTLCGSRPEWSPRLCTSEAHGLISVFQGESKSPRCLRKRECIVFLLLFPFSNQSVRCVQHMGIIYIEAKWNATRQLSIKAMWLTPEYISFCVLSLISTHRPEVRFQRSGN